MTISIAYVAKLNSMYVREVYYYSDEVVLTANKYNAKHLTREDIEWLKRTLDVKILKVKVSYEEIGIGDC